MGQMNVNACQINHKISFKKEIKKVCGCGLFWVNYIFHLFYDV